jgi:hypothetical protein
MGSRYEGLGFVSTTVLGTTAVGAADVTTGTATGAVVDDTCPPGLA